MSERFNVFDTRLDGLRVIERKPRGDARGSFCRLFCDEELREAGWTDAVSQINHSRTLARGAVRGMHYQRAPHGEAKFVMCVRGAVHDVAVDLRRGSPSLLHWHAEILSADNARAMLIPAGFAHGFQVLEPNSELIYLHGTPYAPDAEGGIHPEDPRCAIAWPLPVFDLSPRDSAHALLGPAFEGLDP